MNWTVQNYSCVIVNWTVHSYNCVIVNWTVHSYNCVIVNWTVDSYSCVIVNWFYVIALCFRIHTDKTFKSSINKQYLFVLDAVLSFNYCHHQRRDFAQSLIICYNAINVSHIPMVLGHRGIYLSLPALRWRTAQCWTSQPGSGHSGWCSWPAWVVPTCDLAWTRWCPAQRWRVLLMAAGLLERRNERSSRHLPANKRGPGWENSRILCY